MKKGNLINKRALINIVSVILIIIGIGFISWFALNISLQLSYENKPYQLTNKVEKPEPTIVVDDLSFKNLYPIYPVEGENIGTLTIPTLNRTLPIFQGTTTKELSKGAGHFIESALPGENNNSVISGHRDTAFRQLDKIKIDDLLIVETSAGIFTYKVTGTRIVEANDQTVIVYTDHAVLTLTTCYPFHYIGSAPKRYIVSADLIQNEEL